MPAVTETTVFDWANTLHDLSQHSRELKYALRSLENFILKEDSVFNKQGIISAQTSDATLTNYIGSDHSTDSRHNNDSKSTESMMNSPCCPQLFSDSSLRGVVRALTNKFPSLPDFRYSYNSVFHHAKNNMLSELKSLYEVFRDVERFCLDSVVAIQQSVHFRLLNMSTNPELCVLFLNAVVDFISIVYSMHELSPLKKAVVGGYAAAYRDIVGITEMNYPSLSAFLVETESPLQFVQTKLIMAAPKIAALILSFKFEIGEGGAGGRLPMALTAKELRLSGVLSLTNQVGGVKAPVADSKLLRGLAQQLHDFRIIMTGLLACPNEIARPGRYNRLFLACLNYSNDFLLNQEGKTSVFQEYSKFNVATGTANSKSKLLQSLGDGQTHLSFHSDRREYLIYQLKQTIHLIKEPDTLRSKFGVIQTQLAFAKDEIISYLHHQQQQQASHQAIENRDKSGFDLSVAELMWYLKAIVSELKTRKTEIQGHVLEQIQQLHFPRLLETIDTYITAAASDRDTATATTANTPEKILTESILPVLNNLSSETDPQTLTQDLKAFRRAVHSFQVTIGLPFTSSPQLDPLVFQIVSALDKISWQSRWLDEFHEALDLISCLKEVFPFRRVLVEHLKASVLSSGGIEEFLGVYRWIVEDFCKMVGVAGMLGSVESSHVENLVKTYLVEVQEQLSSHCARVIHELALVNVGIASVCAGGGRMGQMKKGELAKRDGKLKILKNIASNLLSTCRTPKCITINGCEYNLISAIVEKLGGIYSNHLSDTVSAVFKIIKQPPDHEVELFNSIKTPSELLMEHDAYFSMISFVDSISSANATPYLQSIHTSKTESCPTATRTRPLSFKDINKRDKHLSNYCPQSITELYILLYSDMIMDVTAGKKTVFSLSRNCLLKLEYGCFLQPENYSRETELSALYDLVGDLGFHKLQSSLAELQGQCINEVKELLVLNKDTFQGILFLWLDETKTAELFKKLKSLKRLLEIVILIGTVSQFREMLSKVSHGSQKYIQLCTSIQDAKILRFLPIACAAVLFQAFKDSSSTPFPPEFMANEYPHTLISGIQTLFDAASTSSSSTSTVAEAKSADSNAMATTTAAMIASRKELEREMAQYGITFLTRLQLSQNSIATREVQRGIAAITDKLERYYTGFI
ncbi:membrane-associated apoptosis protein-domain-containing protein [Obelidium mucronatum]|nr:membrane-associated apoptosis protein-domain-containing protein [Obelidium mucronatum]